ncbi:MAG TPA: ATP-binding protein [Gemmataceae bacterium]|jgi:ABC-type Na+ transport system ATPase subunit NatA
MLKRVHIKGFRSCQDVLIDDLGSMTALIGRNGSGKTNILRALETLGRIARSSDLGSAEFDRAPFFSVGSIEIDAERDNAVYRYIFGIHEEPRAAKNGSSVQRPVIKESLAVQTQAGKWRTLVDRIDREIGIAGHSEPIPIPPATFALPTIAAFLPGSNDVQEHVRRLLLFLRTIRYYPFDETSEVAGTDWKYYVSERDHQRWLILRQSYSEMVDSVVLRLFHAYQEEEEHFKEILSLLGRDGLGLIDDIVVHTYGPSDTSKGDAADQEGECYALRFRLGRLLGGDPRLHFYRELSLGTRRVLRIIASLVMDDCTLMLIEQPEDCIHPGLLKKLIDILRANVDPAQIILSSHSAEVFNRLKPEDIRLVSIHRGATTVRPLTRRETSAAARFVSEDGTLADFLETVQEG